MAAVYVNNLVINTGANFSQLFTLEGSATNSSFNLTNYTVASQMRKWSGSTSAISFTSTVESESDGQILLRLTAEQTSAIKPGRYIYDVVIMDEFGVKNRVIEGMVLVREGATR
jgi:hypothetical protein